MKVLMISTDSKILDSGSAVRTRMVWYGASCEELHIIVTKHESRNTPSSRAKLATGQAKHETKIQVAENVFAYPATASNKILALFRAYHIGVSTFNFQLSTFNWLVTSQDPFETGFIGWLIAKKIKAKLQLQVHTDFLSPYFINGDFLNRIRILLARFLLPKADSIRVVSRRIADSLNAKRYTLNAVPKILPIFVDIEKIRGTAPTIDLRKKYPQFDFLVLTTSRLTREKNIELAIEAMREVAKKYPRAGLIIVGSGPEKSNLKLKTENLKLADNVIFEEWSDDIVSYMKTADVFLNTSNYEGFGMSLVEAAASGCPIVSTDVGIVGDILRPEDVLVCSAPDAGCISDQLKRIIRFPELRRELSLKAQTSIEALVTSKEEYLLKIGESW
ncbi:MAG: glycosyltransferase [Patescibacteria group bacterium]